MNSQNVAVWEEPHQHTARAERPKTTGLRWNWWRLFAEGVGAIETSIARILWL